MGKVKQFEDLRCWQKARELVRAVYTLVSDNPLLARDFRLRDQLTSAAVSVMSNIAEGFGRYHKRDFIRFLDIASSSASEVKSLLYVVSDLAYASSVSTEKAQALADEAKALTLGLLRYIKGQLNVPPNTLHEPPNAYTHQTSNPPITIPEQHLNTSIPKHPNT